MKPNTENINITMAADICTASDNLEGSLYLYKLGASWEEEGPPNTQILPITNQIAIKQSKTILNLSTRMVVL